MMFTERKGYTTNRKKFDSTNDIRRQQIWGGYQGEGAKASYYKSGFHKISMRLVPNQDWHESALFTKHFSIAQVA
jgi:hypothetical protein